MLLRWRPASLSRAVKATIGAAVDAPTSDEAPTTASPSLQAETTTGLETVVPGALQPQPVRLTPVAPQAVKLGKRSSRPAPPEAHSTASAVTPA